jgi:hypothetical protein
MNSQAGFSALHFASSAGAQGAIDALLAAGAKPSVWEARKKHTPLHLAALKGHAGCVASLLRGGADPVAQTKKGETPFDLGAHHPAVSQALRDHLDQQQAAYAAMAKDESSAAGMAASALGAVSAATIRAAAEVEPAATSAAQAPEATTAAEPVGEAAVEAASEAAGEPARKKVKKDKKKGKGVLSLSHLEDGDVPF